MRNATADQIRKKAASDIKQAAQLCYRGVPERIRRVASLLNASAGKNNPEQRKNERYQFIAPCRVTFDTHGLGALLGQDSYVHNMSRSGVGLLLTEPRTKDDLIEIRMNIDPQVVYLAGVIVYCRHIEGNVHEAGVQLHQRSDAPLLQALNGMNDKDAPEWFNNARKKLRESRNEKKRSE